MMDFGLSRQNIVNDLIRQAEHFLSTNPTRPFVTLCFAQSLDGCLSAEQNTQTKISHDESHILTHQIRAINQGILVGINTILVDDPKLNVRLVSGSSPRPIIIDPELTLNPELNIFKLCNQPMVFCHQNMLSTQICDYEASTGATAFNIINNSSEDLPSILKVIKSQGIHKLMVEGGGKTIFNFCNLELVDYIVMTLSPRFLGSQNSVRYSNFSQSITSRIENVSYAQLGSDLIIRGKHRNLNPLAKIGDSHR